MAQKRHQMRDRNGDLVVMRGFTRGKAIKAFCTQCLGFETHPKDCTATECALYPYRGKIYVQESIAQATHD